MPITILLEIYSDTAHVFHRQIELPEDAGDGLLISAVRDLAVLYLQERKEPQP